MVRKRPAPNAPLKVSRIDSGAVMSSDTVAPNGSSSSRTLEMPRLRGTNWDRVAPNARLYEDDLQLKQPKGFPIILMPSTLERARKEADAETEAVRNAEPYFKIYEDGEEDDVGSGDDVDAEGEDEYEIKEEEEHSEADEHEAGHEESSEYEYEDENDYNDKNNYYAQLSTAKPILAPVTRKPLAVVDRLGRTRAAAQRLKAALEISQPADAQNSPSVSDDEDKATNSKKRKRGVRQAAKKPRKTQILGRCRK